MLPFKTYSIEDLDPKIRAKIARKDEQRKYREKVIEAAIALNAGERFAVPFLEFIELYSFGDTLRVWVSKLNKKYPDRQYTTVFEEASGNTWVCRMK